MCIYLQTNHSPIFSGISTTNQKIYESTKQSHWQRKRKTKKEEIWMNRKTEQNTIYKIKMIGKNDFPLTITIADCLVWLQLLMSVGSSDVSPTLTKFSLCSHDNRAAQHVKCWFAALGKADVANGEKLWAWPTERRLECRHFYWSTIVSVGFMIKTGCGIFNLTRWGKFAQKK